MAVPPGDQYANDPAILDDTKLLRRIPPGKVVKDDSLGRPQSDNFDDSHDGTGTSVTMWVEDDAPQTVLKDHERFGLVWITAEDVRKQDLGIIPAPLADNKHHAHIQGKKTGAKKRRLAEAAQWIKRPDPE